MFDFNYVVWKALTIENRYVRFTLMNENVDQAYDYIHKVRNKQ